MGFLALLVIVAIVYLVIKAASGSQSSRLTIPAPRPSPHVIVTASPRATVGGPPTVAQALEQSARTWVPPGRSAQFGNLEIPGGMLYLGRQVQSVRGWGAEPALIDPALRVEPGQPGLDDTMGYWPSYADIPPSRRGAYLQWLATGRRDRSSDMGIPFLFLYGIERRLLFNAVHLPAAQVEIPALVQEVERLLEMHRDHHSFCGYASHLLEFVRAREWARTWQTTWTRRSSGPVGICR